MNSFIPFSIWFFFHILVVICFIPLLFIILFFFLLQPVDNPSIVKVVYIPDKALMKAPIETWSCKVLSNFGIQGEYLQATEHNLIDLASLTAYKYNKIRILMKFHSLFTTQMVICLEIQFVDRYTLWSLKEVYLLREDGLWFCISETLKLF